MIFKFQNNSQISLNLLFSTSLISLNFHFSLSSLVSFVIEAAVAANATASTATSVTSADVKSVSDAEPKNKRQVDEYLRTPGTSAASSLNDQGPQAFPLQLSHGIYNQQQRVPLYTRRPTTISHKPQVTEDDVEQEQPQRQVRFTWKQISICNLANV